MPREIDKFLAPRPGKVTPGIPGHPLPPRPGGKPPPLPKAVEDFEITVEAESGPGP